MRRWQIVLLAALLVLAGVLVWNLRQAGLARVAPGRCGPVACESAPMGGNPVTVVDRDPVRPKAPDKAAVDAPVVNTPLDDAPADAPKPVVEPVPGPQTDTQRLIEEARGSPCACEVTVRGRVLDKNGNPAPGATISCLASYNWKCRLPDGSNRGGGGSRNSYEPRITANERGEFELRVKQDAFEHATIHLFLYASGKGGQDSKSLALNLRNQEIREDVELRLLGSGQLTGRVVDISGQPLKGVQVWAYFIGDERHTTSTATDDDGRFKLVGIAEGDYKVALVSDAFCLEGRPIAVSVARDSTTQLPVDMVAVPTPRMRLRPCDGEGKPIHCNVLISVHLEDSTFQRQIDVVGDTGCTFVLNLSAGEYDLVISLGPAYRPYKTRLQLDYGRTSDLGDITFEPVPLEK